MCERFVHSTKSAPLCERRPAPHRGDRLGACHPLGPQSPSGAFSHENCPSGRRFAAGVIATCLPRQSSRGGRCAPRSVGWQWRCNPGRCGGVRSRASEARRFGRRRGPTPGSTAGASGRRAHLPERGRMPSPAARAARRLVYPAATGWRTAPASLVSLGCTSSEPSQRGS